MTLDEAILAVNARPLTDFEAISKARNGGYICPICGSGSGASGTGGFSRTQDGKRYRCFACDAFSSDGHETQDTLGALRVIWHCDTLEVLRRAGYDVTGGYSAAHEARGLSDQTKQALSPTRAETPRQDFSAYLRRCREQLERSPEAIAYITGRGISLETARAFGIGYDAAADPAGAGHICPRLIYATRKAYAARSTRADTPQAFKTMYPKGQGNADISNSDALYSGAPAVYVCEGIFDAMSIAEAGGQAVSLNSVTNSGRLLDQLRQRPTAARLLLSLDNDDAGRERQQKLLADLQKLGVQCSAVNVSGAHKDPNDALRADRRAFTEAVQRELLREAFSLPTREEASTVGDDQGDGFQFETTADYIRRGGFSSDILKTVQAGELVTGFRQLDSIMNGWTTGLHIVSGAPGTGKTAFCGQLADGIAAGGRDVIYYSLEIPRGAMTARALARIALQKSGVRYVGEQAAREQLSALDILRSRCPADRLDQLAQEYAQRVGDRLTVIDAKMTVDDIRNHARQHFRTTGRRPVLIVDYLQILGLLSSTAQADAKRYTDDVVTALVELSKELNTHVFAISSLARSGYTKDADYSALKESGLIEYGASTVLALQLRLIYTKVKVVKTNKKTGETSVSYRDPLTAELDAEKQKSPRRLDLSVLKSRSGGVGQHIELAYYSRCDQFDEIASAAAELAADTTTTGGGGSWTDAETE